MTYRLEIRLKDGLLDASGVGILKKSRAYFGLDVDDVRVIRVLTIDAHFDAEQRLRIQKEIFTNPITEQSSYTPIQRDFDWLIWVGFRPGVRDTQGSTAREAIEDLLGVEFKSGEAVYTSKCYEVSGNLTEDQAHRIATELLSNAAIQQWKIFSRESWDSQTGIGFLIPKVILSHEPEVKTLSIESNDALKCISKERNLALQDRDIPVIREYFLRKDILEERKAVGLDLPTDVELEYTWSWNTFPRREVTTATTTLFGGNFIITTFEVVSAKPLTASLKPASKRQLSKSRKKRIGWFRFCGITPVLPGLMKTITTALRARPTTVRPTWRLTAAPSPESWVFTGIPWARERGPN